MSSVLSFSGTYRFLSNFYPAPLHITDELLLPGESPLWPSTEHAYQAFKSKDPEFRKSVRAGTAGEAKKLGRRAVLRPGWEQIKVPLMVYLALAKFTQHEDLRQQLLATGDIELVEGNTWGDRFWGVCDGQGSNMLGRTLMLVRTVLRRRP